LTAGASLEDIQLSLAPSHEEQLLRESVHGIASKYGPKYMIECHEAGRPPAELWDEIGAKGFVGANIPVEFGGGGLGMTGLVAVQEELAKAGTTMLLMIVSPAIAGSILAAHGTPEQQSRWLPGIAAGTERCSFAVTESGAGTNTHKLATRARLRDDGTWTVRGQKTFISAVEHATSILLVARREHDDGTLGRPLLFVMDAEADGLTRQQVPTALRAPDKQWTLFLDDVTLEGDRLVGGEEGGLGVLFDGLNPERLMVGAGSIGTAQRALACAVEYARERDVWGQPIGAHQAVAHPLAERKIEIELGRLMLQKACALSDAGAPDAGEAANIAKFACAEAAIHTVDQAIQTHGGNGLALEYGLTDMWWWVRLQRIAPVSREMILNYVAQHSLGLPKSY
jgi:alkylation response protein AidB-like acyl-CoA dehydrogenase